jgi:hypothetical protein
MLIKCSVNAKKEVQYRYEIIGHDIHTYFFQLSTAMA